MSDTVRVVMWTTPRSRASIVAKCMDRVPGSKILFQLSSSAYRASLDEFTSLQSGSPAEKMHDALVDPKSSDYDEGKSTYPWMKNQMEADYPGKRFVFAKEMAYCIDGKFEYLPEGYRHIFLIRDPVKVFQSFKRCVPEIIAIRGLKGEEGKLELDKLSAKLLGKELAFKEAVNVYEYLQEKNIEPDPIIVDSDDLVNDPASILPALFQRLGVEYHESILNWEKGADVLDSWVVSKRYKYRIRNVEYFRNFRDSTKFLKPEAITGTTHTGVSLTADVQRCVDFSRPYYMKLYEKRLTI
ncbi:uncharacterized protein LOC110989032 [Acanthaster planci]|uniref:Uncharacterized protein LOC110989032 n=1 Tax=Acanthaster planci TaxID=133434 RepID=A0A8B7ZTP5_ACAPL|nr:uncharacterized protein LOC110989032 [Acanthaster planci]